MSDSSNGRPHVEQAEPAVDGIDSTTLERLASVSTATLNTQLFKRGLRNTYMKDLRPANPKSARFVGAAFTLRYIPAREDLDVVEVFEDPAHPQRDAIEKANPGDVLVMDCRQDASAASGGSILITRMKVRGLAGLVTDAGIRDFPTVSEVDFPVFSQGPNPAVNLVRHHAVDIQVPIGCGGVPVYPGDVLVGDAEGVIVIPRNLAQEVAEEAESQEDLERFIVSRIESGYPLPGTYPPDDQTRGDYEAWRSTDGSATTSDKTSDPS